MDCSAVTLPPYLHSGILIGRPPAYHCRIRVLPLLAIGRARLGQSFESARLTVIVVHLAAFFACGDGLPRPTRS